MESFVLLALLLVNWTLGPLWAAAAGTVYLLLFIGYHWFMHVFGDLIQR
jgi:hypothetical protein